MQVEEIEELEDDTENGPASTPNLNVQVSTSFPQSEIFGIKLINGHPTVAVLNFENHEPTPITVGFVGGTLWTPAMSAQGEQLVRNLTTVRYNVEIPAGEKNHLTYSFATEMHPQDLTLSLVSVLSDSNGSYYTIQAFNETVSVVEAPTSIFDPQM